MASITGKPNEMLGTNTPSITSRWNHSQVLSLSRSMSRCKWPKSADSSDGAIFTFMSYQLGQYIECTKVKLFNEATAHTLP